MRCSVAIPRWPNSSTGQYSTSCAAAWVRQASTGADVVQPVLFSVMVSLAAQWRAIGIEPEAVIGHSQGEIAAAYVRGCPVVARLRQGGRAAQKNGGMASIPLSVKQVDTLIAPWRDSISVAGQNGPYSTIVTGDSVRLQMY